MAITLYHPTLLDRDRAPRCAGPLPAATHQATVDNPLCGDVLTMRLQLGPPPDSPEARIILAAAFEGRGCAVSRAAASLWTQRLPGCTVAEATALLARYAHFCAEPPEAPMDEDLGDLTALAGVRAVKTRRLCATLASRALQQALGKA